VKKVVIVLIFGMWILGLLLLSGPVEAAPLVLINGRSVSFDVPPQMENNRALVPMRAIFEFLGAEVTWKPDTNTAEAKKGQASVSLQVGSLQATSNGKPITLDCPPKIIDGRTMVPLRFVAEALGANVRYDPPTQTISIVTQSSSGGGELSSAAIAAKVGPSVVFITAMDANGKPVTTGSGVIASADGKIITNYHAIRGAGSVAVKTKDGQTFNCTSLGGYNEERDIAILLTGAAGLIPASLGDSDMIATGEKILTIGCPRMLENTVSDGLISNKSRGTGNSRVIQISAPIDHGSSGGALVDMKGRVIGITKSGVDNAQNLNFAIPINDVKEYLNSNQNVPLSTASAPKMASASKMQELQMYLNSRYGQIVIGGSTLKHSMTVTSYTTAPHEGSAHIEIRLSPESNQAIVEVLRKSESATEYGAWMGKIIIDTDRILEKSEFNGELYSSTGTKVFVFDNWEGKVKYEFVK